MACRDTDWSLWLSLNSGVGSRESGVGRWTVEADGMPSRTPGRSWIRWLILTAMIMAELWLAVTLTGVRRWA